MIVSRSQGRGLVAVPARMASTRLPEKLLLSQTGRPLLAHVLQRCRQAVDWSDGLLTETILACDHPQLAKVATDVGVRAVPTGRHHRCGTTRIAEAVELLEPDEDVTFVVNVQGDEPEIRPEAILEVSRLLLRHPTSEMATLTVAIPQGREDLKENPAVVKAILDQNGRALYFTRSPAPYARVSRPDEPIGYHHLGIYAYRRDFLSEYARMPASPLEEMEGLEQLRAIETGHCIQCSVVPADWAGKGIDTAADYDAFVQRTRKAG